MSIRKIFILAVLGLSLSSFAEEAKKEGEKVETPEWMELQTQIGTLEARRQQKQEAILKAIEEKQKLKANSPQIKIVLDQMLVDYNEMRRLNDEKEKKLTVLKFRYPEKGMAEELKYKHQKIEPLEQMEQELSIDGRLNRNKKRVRTQYQLKKTGPGTKDSADKLGSNQEDPMAPEKPKEKSIDESETLILKK